MYNITHMQLNMLKMLKSDVRMGEENVVLKLVWLLVPDGLLISLLMSGLFTHKSVAFTQDGVKE